MGKLNHPAKHQSDRIYSGQLVLTCFTHDQTARTSCGICLNSWNEQILIRRALMGTVSKIGCHMQCNATHFVTTKLNVAKRVIYTDAIFASHHLSLIVCRVIRISVYATYRIYIYKHVHVYIYVKKHIDTISIHHLTHIYIYHLVI